MLPEYELVEAVKKGSVEGINAAIEKGATLAARDLDGTSLLEVAQKHGKLDAARHLIKLGCDVDESNDKGDTLLHKSVRRQDIGFAGLLLEEGAYKYPENKAGKHPIDYAKPDSYMRRAFTR